MNENDIDPEAIALHKAGVTRGVEVTIASAGLAEEDEDPIVPMLGFAYALAAFVMAMDIDKEMLHEIIDEVWSNLEPEEDKGE